jgi:CubicO group peptidase (beta-lactamase class C family)
MDYYDNHNNSQEGGKIVRKKIKMVEYENKVAYEFNNIDKQKLTEESEFPIASISKIFIIVSLLLLQERWELNINDKIGKYLDYEEIDDLKIIDIMNHRSGLKKWYNKVKNFISKIKYNCATDVYKKYNKNNLFNEDIVGEFSYSNIGYIILGVLIEKITGAPYYEFIKENILVPLKMNNTGVEDCNVILYNINRKKLNKNQILSRSLASSAGQFKSCIKDLIKFSQFPKLLKKHSLELLKDMYICKNKIIEISLHHNGGITGAKSEYKIDYDKHWKVKDIYIKLRTIAF